MLHFLLLSPQWLSKVWQISRSIFPKLTWYGFLRDWALPKAIPFTATR